MRAGNLNIPVQDNIDGDAVIPLLDDLFPLLVSEDGDVGKCGGSLGRRALCQGKSERVWSETVILYHRHNASVQCPYNQVHIAKEKA
jgi:hypothetical protein